jgi:hypothetical protein
LRRDRVELGLELGFQAVALGELLLQPAFQPEDQGDGHQIDAWAQQDVGQGVAGQVGANARIQVADLLDDLGLHDALAGAQACFVGLGGGGLGLAGEGLEINLHELRGHGAGGAIAMQGEGEGDGVVEHAAGAVHALRPPLRRQPEAEGLEMLLNVGDLGIEGGLTRGIDEG